MNRVAWSKPSHSGLGTWTLPPMDLLEAPEQGKGIDRDHLEKCAVDLETTSLEPMRAGIVGFSFAFREGEAFYLPLNLTPEESDLPPAEQLVEALRPHLVNPAIGKAANLSSMAGSRISPRSRTPATSRPSGCSS